MILWRLVPGRSDVEDKVAAPLAMCDDGVSIGKDSVAQLCWVLVEVVAGG